MAYLTRMELRLVVVALTGSLVFLLFLLAAVPLDSLDARLDDLPNPLQKVPQSNLPSSSIWNTAATHGFRSSSQSTKSRTNALGVASKIFVVSLARRTDRRARMEKLRRALRVEWEYVDALEKDDVRVRRIMRHVRQQRALANVSRQWPEDNAFTSLESLVGTEVDLWPHSVAGTDEEADSENADPLLCATDNNTVPTYDNISAVPFHLILSGGMLACWYSHLSVIKRIADQGSQFLAKHKKWDGKKGVAIVFEDDVDVEWNLQARLTGMWADLPTNWDMVMLGHCWSNETVHPPLTPTSPLHPSAAPKCTHAYALSPRGAMRLHAHLTHPPFAYGRALDQAIAHLIAHGKLRSFSVVPSVAVQLKSTIEDGEDSSAAAGVGISDIWAATGSRGMGSSWKDQLQDSAVRHFAELEDGIVSSFL